MASPLSVRRVELAPLPAEQAPAVGKADWYAVEVYLRNRSEAALNVVADLRGIEYDEEDRLLRLTFAEASEEPEVADVPTPASTVTIEAGEETTLTARLPSPITTVEESDEGELRKVEIRIDADVDTVECAVAYSEEAPPRFDLTALEPSPRTADWPVATGSTELRQG